jgi:malate synthase
VSRKRKVPTSVLELALSSALVSVGRTVQRAAGMVGRALPSKPAGRPKASRGRAPGRRPGTVEARKTTHRWRPSAVPGVSLRGAARLRDAEWLTSEALAFVADLHRRFGARAREASSDNEAAASGEDQFQDRRIEITNDGVLLIDFEQPDATWAQLVERHLQFKTRDGTAAVIMRPRGLQVVEENVLIDAQPVSAGLFDVGLCAFHAAGGAALHCDFSHVAGKRGARLWNEVLAFAEAALGLAAGTIKAAVIIGTRA